MLRSLFTNSARERETVAPVTAVKQLNPHELQQWLESNKPAPLLVDVRTPGEYEYDGHIDGARLLPLSSLMQRMNELPKDRPIVCVCRSGARSYTACEMLSAQGFDAINLSGGMIGWKRSGFPQK